MVSRNQLIDRMAVGYSPVCKSQPGLWSCYPMMPKFGLMGVGAVQRNYSVVPRYGSGVGMLTGRITYGLGQPVTVDTTWFTDPSQGLLYGVPNWITLGFAGFAAFAMVFTVGTGVRATKRGAGKARRKISAAKAAFAAA